MILATTDTLPEREIIQTLSVVRGNAVRARHLGKDIQALLRNLVGGEIHGYVKLLAEAREQAMDRMVEEAEHVGANAILGIRFTTSMVSQGAAELLAYGTAVVVDSP